MIKSEVVNKGERTAEVNVIIEGTPSELFAEIRGILKSFDENSEMTFILVKAMDKLLEETKKED